MRVLLFIALLSAFTAGIMYISVALNNCYLKILKVKKNILKSYCIKLFTKASRVTEGCLNIYRTQNGLLFIVSITFHQL